MINSFIDLDFYKLTMGQLVFFKHQNTVVDYEFVCRSDFDFRPYYSTIVKNIRKIEDLRLNDQEYSYLIGLGFKSQYLDFLKNIELDTVRDIKTNLSSHGKLSIKIHGYWHECIYYETYLLSIINEVINQAAPFSRILENFKEKEFPNVAFYEFGTRRRLSSVFQEEILSIICNYYGFSGTSNAHLAHKLSLPVMGTMAHEYIQAYQQLHPVLNNFQKKALYDWLDFYKGSYAIALSDTINDKHFIRDFFLEDNAFLAHNFDGIRHDSGDPVLWALKMAQKTVFHNIKNLSLLFSDNLNPDVINKIESEEFLKKFKKSYSLGSYFVNNYHGACNKTPIQMVIKLIYVNGFPVMKLSNEPQKSICKDEEFKELFLNTFN